MIRIVPKKGLQISLGIDSVEPAVEVYLTVRDAPVSNRNVANGLVRQG